MPTVTDAERKLVEAILSAYHTTRLKDTDPVEHVLSKGTVQQAFARHREQEVAKIVAWLDRYKAEAVEMENHQAAFWIVQMKKSIQAGEYRNDA